MASYRGSAVAPGMLLLSPRPFESDAFHINLVPRAFPSEIGRGDLLVNKVVIRQAVLILVKKA